MSDRILPLAAAYDLLPEPVACYEGGTIRYENPAFRAALPRLSAVLPQVLGHGSGIAEGWSFRNWAYEGLTIVHLSPPDRTPLVSDARVPLLTGRFRGYLASADLAQDQLEQRMNIFQEAELTPSFAILNQSRMQVLRLLNNLDLAALADGETPAGFTPMLTDLNGLIDEVAVQLEYLLREVGWALELQANCHSLYVQCDDWLIQTLIYHLVSNAVQANPGWAGNLTLRLEQRGRKAILSLLDDGVGMTPSQLSGAFNPDRPRDTLSELLQGVGTGLIACKNIARAHGGALLLANRARRGFRASLSLPLCKGDDTERCSARRSFDNSNGVPLILRELSTVLPAKCYQTADL